MSFEYLTKFTWQAECLGLRGAEWDVYAYLHNLTKLKKHYYTNGIRYLADILYLGKSTVARALASLEEAELIIRDEISLENGAVSVTRYYVNMEKIPDEYKTFEKK